MPTTIGFIGVGRLGLPLVTRLREHGFAVVGTSRGRVAQLLAGGGTIPGDGTPAAVAEAATILITCLPAPALSDVFEGPRGVLRAAEPLPTALELSTAPVTTKQDLRDRLVALGGELLDCPVSGTPAMVSAGSAVIYASGNRSVYAGVEDLLRLLSPACAYVGDLGQGMKMKHVANLLAVGNLAIAAEAMAFAGELGLDLDQVASLVAASPAATSGQFAARAGIIARGEFDGNLVTVRDTRENLAQISAEAERLGFDLPMTWTAKRLYNALGQAGGDDSDPAKLAWLLRGGKRDSASRRGSS